MAKRPWTEIREKYIQDINSEITLEKLSEEYEIPIDTVKRRSSREGWVSKKEEYCAQVTLELHKKAIKKHSDKLFKNLEFCETIETLCKKQIIEEVGGEQKLKPLTTRQLKDIMETVALNIKTRRLLLGEPESIIKNNHSGSVDLEFSEKEIEDELDELMGIKKRVNDRQKKAAKAEGSDKDTEEEDS